MPTMTTPSQAEDSVMDTQIGILLRVGMYASALVILAGGVLYLAQHSHDQVNYKHFHGVAPSLQTLHGIAAGALHGQSESIIQFGLLMLIATPIARVIFSVFAFFKERDYLYVGISALVLLVLLYSIIWH